MNKLPISALVVSLNEGKLLGDCLDSIYFCDEIVLVDLGSSDNSVQLAQSKGVQVIHHEVVPVVEIIRAKYYQQLEHDWILCIDPDEAIDKELRLDIERLFERGIARNVGVLHVPWQFYLAGKPLKGTIWGGIKEKRLIFHKDRVQLNSYVHNGLILKEGYTELSITYRNTNVLHHYWMQNVKQLIEKHRRYLALEGPTRYALGHRTTLRQLAIHPFLAFKLSFLDKEGYRDKISGFLLSLFWMWYSTASLDRLYRIQLREEQKDTNQ
ncbi:glycosyltransferase [Cesiribacter sp. SM1]|uniref:glycosyltransferase n=1 Tax=Cesiribacter sp. SM1 TaxID=2861196 RepID=UPI001CD21E96|nr:glycosyltransferase [Cesiribacter sp. SM1]